MSFGGPNGLVSESEYVSTTVLVSTHLVEQLSFCMFPSILIFDFYLILDIFDFLRPNWATFRVGWV